MEMQSSCVLPSNASALDLQAGSNDPGSDNSDGATVPTGFFSHNSHQRKSYGSRSNEIKLKLKEKGSFAVDNDGNKISYEDVRDPILTRSELQSPKYLAYRSKQRNPKGSKNGKVWTDELEEAFQQALRAIPLLGRKKKQYASYGEKQWGRNELISLFIKERTGVLRTRKQVSSHIQVLKAFLVKNGTWMALVTQTDQNESQNGHHRHDRRLSNHLVKPESRDCLDVERPPYFNRPKPLNILRSSAISQGYSVRRVSFEMYILDQDLKKLHVYSSLQSEIGSVSRDLEKIPNWQLLYPQLASYYDRGQLDGEILLFESNFNLMGKHPPPKSNLTIDFTIDIARGMNFSKWECHSDFYERGVLQKSLSTRMDFEYLSSVGDARIVVLLHSKWWVDLFTDITKQKQEIEEEDAEALQQAEERIRRQIRDISVVQEVWATHQTSESTPERMAILIWSFRQTQNHEIATTTWRKLIPPIRKAEPYTPTPDITHPQSSFILDAALQHPDLQQHTPLYAQHFNPEPLFAENSETLFTETGARLSPSPSTPAHDYHSLPSSTSISFPSSISSSTLPPELSQGSFASQEPIFHCQELDYQGQELDSESQDQVLIPKVTSCPSENPCAPPSQDTGTTGSQHSNFSSQDYYYISQEAVSKTEDMDSQYSGPDHPRYLSNQRNYHEIISNNDVDGENSTQELQNQLSFATSKGSPYDAPYIAPLARIMTPGQLHYNELQHQSQYLQLHSQKNPSQTCPSQQIHHDDFDLNEWQILENSVEWTTSKSFQNTGNLNEVGDVLKHVHVFDEIGELNDSVDAELTFQ